MNHHRTCVAFVFAALPGCVSEDFLVLDEDLVLCSTSPLGETLVEASARKARLGLRAGRYALPGPGTELDFDLGPGLSIEFAGGQPLDLGTAEGGRIDHVEGRSILAESDPERAWLWLRQPLEALDERWDAASLIVELDRELDASQPFTIQSDPDMPLSQRVLLVQGERGTSFSGCTLEAVGWGRDILVEFEGGELRFRVRYGETPSLGAKPAQPVEADGTLDGQPFAQSDWFELIYVDESLGHASFSFALRFPEPIGEACGVALRNLNWQGPDAREETFALTDCDFAEIETRALVRWGVEEL